MKKKSFLEVVESSFPAIVDELEFLSNEGEKFDCWVALNYGVTDDYPTEFQLVDGPCDKGIDAVWIDENEEKFIILQGKWSSTGKSTCNDIDVTRLVKAPELLSNYARCKKLSPSVSEASDKYKTYVTEEKYSVELLFVYTGTISSQGREEAESYSGPHDLKLVDWKELYNVWEAKTKSAPQEITLEIVDEQCFTLPDTKKGIIDCVAKIKATSLKEEVSDNYGIYEENVRYFLGVRKGLPNNSMKETIKKEPSHFFYLNNGITLVCKKITINDKSGSKYVTLTSPQIVNGGQTTRVICDAENVDDVTVLARMSVPTFSNYIGDVSEATNKQSSVSERDFKSKDPKQMLVHKYFLSKKYFYDFRRGSWEKISSDERKKLVKVNNEIASKATLSYLEKPAEAKNKKKFLFESGISGYYDDIIKCSPSLIYLSYRVYAYADKQKSLFKKMQGPLFDGKNFGTDEKIADEKKRELQEEYMFIVHSVEHFTYSIMYLIEDVFGDLRTNSDVAIENVLDDGEKALGWLYNFVINQTRSVVLRDGNKRELRNIFIDSKTASAIKTEIDAKNDEYYRDEGKSFAERFREKQSKF